MTNFIVGNEPNVNRFWQPQYTNGQDAAAKDYEHTLAYAYDKIKVARPDSVIWGPAISSRGNDNATAASNPSHSPVWFIADMAAAYKASGRTKPIFDAFNMHPYPPIQDTDPFSKPFQWPQAGAANLDRIKQALWDGFNGTAQPIPAEQIGGRQAQSARFGDAGLPIELDEVGEQTNVLQTSHAGAYTQDGAENITPIDEATQAQHYTDLAEMAACDPDVQSLLYFPLIDNTPIAAGFQSGQLYADLAHKQSYSAMKQKIASAHGQCTGGVSGVPTTWVHTTSVLGAKPYFNGNDTSSFVVPTQAVRDRLASGVGYRERGCDLCRDADERRHPSDGRHTRHRDGAGVLQAGDQVHRPDPGWRVPAQGRAHRRHEPGAHAHARDAAPVRRRRSGRWNSLDAARNDQR